MKSEIPLSAPAPFAKPATAAAQEEIAALRASDFANQAEYDAAVQAIVDKYLGL